MFVAVSRLKIAPERSDELVAAFRERAGLVDSAEGFCDIQVWRSIRDAGEIVMVSRWRDRESFKRYMRSEEHKISHSRIDPELQEEIELARFEQLDGYEVVAE
jgi:heme-degrading monooxygenase HmoA